MASDGAWTAYLKATGPEYVADQQAEDFVDELAEHGGAVSFGEGEYGATFSVEAEDPLVAAQRAHVVFRAAADRAGLPWWPVVHLEVVTELEQDRALSQPPTGPRGATSAAAHAHRMLTDS